MQKENRNIILTAALPYANGPIHIGHLVEHLYVDFWARFQKMRGHDCLLLCADDTHGTPIMVKAREQKITPESLIAHSQKEHIQDFKDFYINYDHYGSTNSDENRNLCELFYNKLKDKNYIEVKPVKQLYCEHDKMFLPDRFVKGICPKCGAKDQYGDSCDVCASTYSPADLKDPYCSLCKNKPIFKTSDHYFVKLNLFKEFLREWIPQHTSTEIAKKMMEWFNEDLRDWDISRDEPYFGFSIPGTNNKKYFYVWVDAPMGYISTTQQWCQLNNKNLNDYWKNDKAEIYHCIGKDIPYFHLLFWPALLKAAEFNTPTEVFVHGMLMVNGEKMSKSKGTNISARTYLNHLNPEYLRYYFASKINSHPDDLDLNLEDFTSRVNSELVGKITNLGSRGAQMLTKKMDSIMSEPDSEGAKLIKSVQQKSEEIAAHFEARDFSKAINEIRLLADLTNKYFDEKAPWKTLESNPVETKKVLTATLNIFRILSIYLQPILPAYAQKVYNLFAKNPLNSTQHFFNVFKWTDAQKIITNEKINNYEHLITRIELEKANDMIKTTTTTAAPTSTATNNSTEIDYDEFMKVDLRVGKVIAAEEIKDSDKLLLLKVDIGEGQIKQIIAGIKLAYTPDKLIGRNIVVVANLKPRKMKFGMSEGMVLAAGNGGNDLFVISPDAGACNGQRVK